MDAETKALLEEMLVVLQHVPNKAMGLFISGRKQKLIEKIKQKLKQ